MIKVTHGHGNYVTDRVYSDAHKFEIKDGNLSVIVKKEVEKIRYRSQKYFPTGEPELETYMTEEDTIIAIYSTGNWTSVERIFS